MVEDCKSQGVEQTEMACNITIAGHLNSRQQSGTLFGSYNSTLTCYNVLMENEYQLANL